MIPDETDFNENQNDDNEGDKETLAATTGNLNFFADMDSPKMVNEEKMTINELEQQFMFLHGPDYFLRDE